MLLLQISKLVFFIALTCFSIMGVVAAFMVESSFGMVGSLAMLLLSWMLLGKTINQF